MSDDDDIPSQPQPRRHPITRLGKHIRGSHHSQTTRCLETLDKRFSRVLVGSLFLGAGYAILSWSHVVAADLHVSFWLGDLPLLSLFTSMVAVALMFLLLVRIRLVKVLRSSGEVGSKAISQKARQLRKAARRECEPSPSALRLLVLLICKVALAAAGMGLASIYQGVSVANVLDHHCGEEGSSRQLEKTYEKLVALLGRCPSFDGRAGSIERCPEFLKEFPAPRPFVEYLTKLEREAGCAGFCSVARPLLTTPGSSAPSSSSSSQEDERCAAVLGRSLRRTSYIVGATGLSLGGVFFVGGVSLFFYDHL